MNKGYWVVGLHRCIFPEELCRFQGIMEDEYDYEKECSHCKFLGAVGNALSLPVMERVANAALLAVGLSQVADRWQIPLLAMFPNGEPGWRK